MLHSKKWNVIRNIDFLSKRVYDHITSILSHGTCNGDPEQTYSGLLNLSLLMALKDVALSSDSACTSASLEPLFVLCAIGTDEDLAHSSIRFGIGRFTTNEVVDYIADKCIKHVERLREMSPFWEMSLLAELSEHPGNIDALKKLELEVGKLPNRTHERLIAYGEKPCEIQRNQLPLPKVDDFSTVCKDFNYIRTDHLGHFNGHKSYYLLGDLANLEQSLIRFTVEYLKRNKFLLMSVPDILPGSFINGCGMQTEGDRTQIYKIETEECLSGTSEMALAGLFSGTVLDEKKLPLKVAAASRCYRAETSGLNEEKGIYRYSDIYILYVMFAKLA
ncbi:uncharacterized protein [Eurosta solidaginis]|uniref:uncharacterized protein n=1 Tax=Eurosta solidaginis TaxID=178769 RepID=UPI003531164B